MADDGYVQLPADGAGQRLRTFESYEKSETDGQPVLVVEEAVVLTTPDGDAVLVGGEGDQAVPVRDGELFDLLNDVRLGLAHLILLLADVGGPARGMPDMTANYVNRVLGEAR